VLYHSLSGDPIQSCGSLNPPCSATGGQIQSAASHLRRTWGCLYISAASVGRHSILSRLGLDALAAVMCTTWVSAPLGWDSEKKAEGEREMGRRSKVVVVERRFLNVRRFCDKSQPPRSRRNPRWLPHQGPMRHGPSASPKWEKQEGGESGPTCMKRVYKHHERVFRGDGELLADGIAHPWPETEQEVVSRTTRTCYRSAERPERSGSKRAGDGPAGRPSYYGRSQVITGHTQSQDREGLAHPVVYR